MEIEQRRSHQGLVGALVFCEVISMGAIAGIINTPELETRGYRFDGRSGTEVLLKPMLNGKSAVWKD